MVFVIPWLSVPIFLLDFQVLLVRVWTIAQLTRDHCAGIGASAVPRSHDVPWMPDGLGEGIVERVKEASPRFQRCVNVGCPSSLDMPVSRCRLLKHRKAMRRRRFSGY